MYCIGPPFTSLLPPIPAINGARGEEGRKGENKIQGSRIASPGRRSRLLRRGLPPPPPPTPPPTVLRSLHGAPINTPPICAAGRPLRRLGWIGGQREEEGGGGEEKWSRRRNAPAIGINRGVEDVQSRRAAVSRGRGCPL